MNTLTLLTSNIRPVVLGEKFGDIFSEYADKDVSDLIKISVGYISVDSIVFLLENIRRNTIGAVELVVGMHAFDGFTKAQYAAVVSLDNELRERNLGQVQLCTAFPFHGKVYSFWKQGNPLLAIVGSSNLNNLIIGLENYYEVDLLFDDSQTLKQTAILQEELLSKASKSLKQWEPRIIKSQPFFHLDIPQIEEVVPNDVAEYWKLSNNQSFLLELKTEAKSNLNVTFAKGRENKKTKVIRPRPWYEAEIVVSSKVTSQKGYPAYKEFQVVTNNGYKFWCQTGGDYSKNFRSKYDLRILGMWIKGQMEEEGALQVGEPVTETVLQRFGKRNIKLTGTTDPNLWLAELV